MNEQLQIVEPTGHSRPRRKRARASASKPELRLEDPLVQCGRSREIRGHDDAGELRLELRVVAMQEQVEASRDLPGAAVRRVAVEPLEVGLRLEEPPSVSGRGVN